MGVSRGYCRSDQYRRLRIERRRLCWRFRGGLKGLPFLCDLET